MGNTSGQLVSQFISERVETPDSEEVDVWQQLVYAALFSAGFTVWIATQKDWSSKSELEDHLNRLISEIAEDADEWINSKVLESRGIDANNIHTHSASEVRFHLAAMFKEALIAVSEHGFQPEVARSHACFAHLSANLRQLSLMRELPESQIQNVLMQGIEGCDAMSKELIEALNKKRDNRKC